MPILEPDVLMVYGKPCENLIAELLNKYFALAIQVGTISIGGKNIFCNLYLDINRIDCANKRKQR